MSEQLLNILKLCLLALVYLFLVRVLRAVWAEVAVPAPANGARRRGRRGAAVPAPPAAPAPAKGRKARGAPTELFAVESAGQAGRRYPLGDEITVGRAAGCQVTVDDTYVSQQHARIFDRGGNWYVEDLGSTNGTFVNEQRLVAPAMLTPGDKIRVGTTIVELRR